jgi:Mg2+-importing ATPase
MGFLTFLDRPKEGVTQAIADLAKLGVSLKVITGDNRLVTQHIAKLVGMPADRVLTGQDLDEVHDEALWRAAEQTDLFVEVDPNQKERIISPEKWGTSWDFWAMESSTRPPCTRRHQPSVESRGRGQRSSRFRSVRTPPGRDPRRDRGRPEDVCQYAQVCADDDEREPRQHGQHGGGFPVSAVFAAFGGTDSPQ